MKILLVFDLLKYFKAAGSIFKAGFTHILIFLHYKCVDVELFNSTEYAF